MSALQNQSAFVRALTGLCQKFLNNPQREALAIILYAAFGALFLIIAILACGVSASVALAYFMSIAAVGVSCLTLARLSAVKAPMPSLLMSPPAAISDNFDLHSGDEADEVAIALDPIPVPSEVALCEPGAEVVAELVDAASADAAPLEPVFPEAATLLTSQRAVSSEQGGLDEPEFERSPVFKLPQRKVAIVRGALREAGGSPASLDAVTFAHAVAYLTKNKAAAGRKMMIPLSAHGVDSDFYFEALDLLADLPGLRDRLIFELPAEALQHADPGFIERLSYGTRQGLHFAAPMAKQFVLSDFITRGPLWACFSYFLMPGDLILGADPEMFRLLEPLGVELIALDIAKESDIIEVLDCHVAFATGPAFQTDSVAVPTTKKPVRKPADPARGRKTAAAPKKARATATKTTPTRARAKAKTPAAAQ